jgi:hypothetical protein
MNDDFEVAFEMFFLLSNVKRERDKNSIKD